MYLLKTNAKENKDLSVQLGIKGMFHEFERLEDLIRFLFTNAHFIEDYRILEAKDYSSSNQSNENSCCENDDASVHISSTQSFARFS